MHALSRFLWARFSSVCPTCCQTDREQSERSLLYFHKAALTIFWQPFCQLSLFLLVVNQVLSVLLRLFLIFNHCDAAITLQTDVAEQTR